MARYKSYNDGQQYFEVINLEKDLPPDNRARIIKEIVCSIDISGFDKNYCNDSRGAKAKHVRMMLGIILLGFVRNIIGSRSIVSQLQTDLEFKYILEGCKIPDDSTIRSFRRRHLIELGEIFSKIVHIGSSLGMNDFGALAIDGTKMQAYASLYETKDKKGLDKSINLLSKQLEKTIERLNVSENESEENELKKRLTNIEKRDQVLKEFQELLSEKDEEEKVNRVDTDARLMQKSDGKPIIGYNAQAGVDCGEHGLIVSAEVYQDATDEKLLEEMRDKAESEVGQKYDVTLADSGYITYETMATASNERRDILGPDRLYEKDLYNTHKNNDYSKSKFIYDNENDIYRCPAGKKLEFHRMVKGTTSELLFLYYNKEACSRCKFASLCISKKGKYRQIYRDYREILREEMRERLQSNEGYLLYGKRSQTVEPIFGDIKYNKGRRQFYYRGIDWVRTEWRLLCTGVNLNKIIRFLEGTDWKIMLNEALSL